MCGIVGYVGNEKNANTVLLRGLQALEYRGYDSAGIATVNQGAVEITKSKGKVSQLSDLIEKENKADGYIGIGHTRWATHGMPNAINAHPHQIGQVTLVHNGIIENYDVLREELSNLGYSFSSQTDTEVCAALIDACYGKTQDKLQALKLAYDRIIGSFALAILFEDELDTIYAMRQDSPLILAKTGECGLIASDISAILEYSNTYYLLEHREIAILTKDNIDFHHLDFGKIEKKENVTRLSKEQIHKNGYEHYMLKEIHEEPEVISSILQYYVAYGEINHIIHMPDFSKYHQIHIVGCGSAMHAGMIAKTMIEKMARIPVSVEIGSEYRYKDPILTPDTLVIVVSQSGETADSLAALRHAKNAGVDTLGVVNVMDSSISLEADFTCMTLAKSEISVATTKAFIAQIMVLSLISLEIARRANLISDKEVSDILTQAKALPTLIQSIIDENIDSQLAKTLQHHEDVFYIGRGMDYALSLEACLKLKEIAYIHCEAYPAGELKHGSIALIEEGTPVISILTDETSYHKTISNMEEVRTRGANVLTVTTHSIASDLGLTSNLLVIPDSHPFYVPILITVPLQLLAYEVAKLRGCEIDQPRNLAKSVTVE